MHPMHRRFHLMKLWLQFYGYQYEYVFMSDIRDVVFQKDPFDWTHLAINGITREGGSKIENALYPILENGWFSISSHGINAAWIRDAFGQDVLDEIGGEKISCSGTTFASVEKAHEYLEKMILFLHQLYNKHGPDYFNEYIFDQGVHNYILYKATWEDKEKIIFLQNAKSPVITLAAFGEYKTDDAGQTVLNDDMSVVNVVHQYDRMSRLLHSWSNRYHAIDMLSFEYKISPSKVQL
jgi:hypothetical protein